MKNYNKQLETHISRQDALEEYVRSHDYILTTVKLKSFLKTGKTVMWVIGILFTAFFVMGLDFWFEIHNLFTEIWKIVQL